LTMARCYARRMGVQAQDLEDIAQETFMLALRNKNADLSHRSAFRTYAVKLAARHAVRNVLGIPRLGRFRIRSMMEPLFEGMARAKPTPGPKLEDVEVAERLLRRMTQREREILVSLSEGASLVNIGKTFGVSKQRVYQILSRVREDARWAS